MGGLNALITSIGSFSAKETIISLRASGKFDKIIGCDIYPSEWHNVSKYFDEVLLAPKVRENEKYFQFIKHLCKQFGINIIVPLTDIEVDFFNEHRDFFHRKNNIITIGNPTFLNIARNKKKLNVYCGKIEGVSRIPSYSFNDISEKTKFPLIAKPVNGRSSEGIFFIDSFSNFKQDSGNVEYIYQEIVEGDICTVDYVRSSQFGSDFCIPRWEHLRTKNGAGMTVEIFHSHLIEKITSNIGKELDINGCVNMEFIINKDNIFLIDVNPRFSAGIGFSKLAGYNFVESHINCFLGKDIMPKIEYNEFIAEKIMTDVINKKL